MPHLSDLTSFPDHGQWQPPARQPAARAQGNGVAGGLAKARRVLLPLALLASLPGCADMPGWMVLQRKSAITDYRHFASAPVLRAIVPSALPNAEGATLNLPPVRGQSFDQLMEQNGTVALVVVQHGKIVLERYYAGYQRDSIVPSFSVAKSVVSALVGIAIDDGHIASLDDPVTRYLPELLRKDTRFARIQLRHLLAMRSGIRFTEGYTSPLDDAARFYLSQDLMARVGQMTIQSPPDQAYHYSSGDTQLLGLVVERATGKPLAHYLQHKIWQPMGAAFDASWSVDSAANGVAKGFCCLNARAVDFARFGQLFLEQGRAHGRQIVPAAWVRDSTAIRTYPGDSAAARANLELPRSHAAAFYGWQWRRAPVPAPTSELGIAPGPNFYAHGHHGQFIYVAPAEDLVIVRLGAYNGKLWWPGLFAHIARLNPRTGQLPAGQGGAMPVPVFPSVN